MDEVFDAFSLNTAEVLGVSPGTLYHPQAFAALQGGGDIFDTFFSAGEGTGVFAGPTGLLDVCTPTIEGAGAFSPPTGARGLFVAMAAN